MTNQEGYFGTFGGSFVPPELKVVLDNLANKFEKYKNDPDFNQEFKETLKEYVEERESTYLCFKTD